MGEAMLRLQPLKSCAAQSETTRHLPQPFLRSVGGDELNVAVALSLLNEETRWISVLPIGPMGDVITDSCSHHGVQFDGTRADGDIGVFTVLPEERSVHYQRRNAAFAQHEPSTLDWARLLDAPKPWLHMTGITPLISTNARLSWDAALHHAQAAGIPTSLDLNHRKQLGTLEELWRIVAPHAAQLELLILSTEQLNGLYQLLRPSKTITPLDADADDDAAFFERLADLQAEWGCRRVALCRKVRDAAGVQRRWSVMTIAGESKGHSTHGLPVWHVPKEELGGGSAWAAGMIHALHMEPLATPLKVMRRADLLAALCQQSAGDFSMTTREELMENETRFDGREARLVGGCPPLTHVSQLPDPAAASSAIEQTVDGLRRAGALAILRVKSNSVETAVARGVELAKMGCLAIEVTLDSPQWRPILAGLKAELPPGVLIGVGTVMDESVSEVATAAALGASFALSPIDPVGFVDECHRRGVLAVPSAFTSNEWYALHRRGTRMIKLFHAGLVSPPVLKSMLGVGPLGGLHIMPPGGVSPTNATEWWDAGAAVVGMGSNLVGDEINFEPGSTDFVAARKKWEGSGKTAAQELFDKARARAATLE